jgi:hypothetical protein
MMIPIAERLVAARVAFEAADMMINGLEMLFVEGRVVMITTFISREARS